ncbi:MAG: response regulator, partial [Lachnospiraceae bacterium]|nr:response regulator [Lachnospiraceae bacterium]
MDKYSVLLVDDEEEVIHVIMQKIDWEALGFCVVGYANNGVKALELVEEFQPDVVMTDIRMPFMDGMELSGRIKAEYPATKILFFTGFDEFEYARGAIYLEVEEYILKPVNSVELIKVFTQLKVKLDQEINEKRNVEILQKYYMESLPLLQANFYTSLIEGRVPEEKILGYLSDYQISFSGPFFCCVVIHSSSSQVPADMNPLLLATSVHRQVEERLVKKWQAKCFSYLGNTVMIPQLKAEGEVAELTDECDRFCKYVQSIIGAVVTVGIGSVCDTILALSQSYLGAKEAVSYRSIYGAARAINMQEVVPKETIPSNSVNDAEMTNLLKMIRLGSEKEVVQAVDRYLKHTSFPNKSLRQHHVDIMELVSTLYRFALNNDISVEGFSEDVRKLYSSLLDLEPTVFRDWLIDSSLAFREKLIHVRNKSTRSFVSKAKEYVRHNYKDEELSLDRVCEELGVSNSYFSSVFKKETGNSFIRYLTDYRLEQASEQLLETSEKSYIIARNVGYTDPNYFSYVFKRKFGVSPSKYRREH